MAENGINPMSANVGEKVGVFLQHRKENPRQLSPKITVLFSNASGKVGVGGSLV